jgi:hypothetical protein
MRRGQFCVVLPPPKDVRCESPTQGGPEKKYKAVFFPLGKSFAPETVRRGSLSPGMPTTGPGRPDRAEGRPGGSCTVRTSFGGGRCTVQKKYAGGRCTQIWCFLCTPGSPRRDRPCLPGHTVARCPRACGRSRLSGAAVVRWADTQVRAPGGRLNRVLRGRFPCATPCHSSPEGLLSRCRRIWKDRPEMSAWRKRREVRYGCVNG